MRDDLGATSFLEEETLQEVGRPDYLAMAERESQVGDAGVKVVDEAFQDQEPGRKCFANQSRMIRKRSSRWRGRPTAPKA
jgi:hypothetical protein